MVLFNNIPYKRMHLTSKVNLTKRFSKKYKCIQLITRLYGILPESVTDRPPHYIPSLHPPALNLRYFQGWKRLPK